MIPVVICIKSSNAAFLVFNKKNDDKSIAP
jgi:hypothetical protein